MCKLERTESQHSIDAMGHRLKLRYLVNRMLMITRFSLKTFWEKAEQTRAIKSAEISVAPCAMMTTWPPGGLSDSRLFRIIQNTSHTYSMSLPVPCSLSYLSPEIYHHLWSSILVSESMEHQHTHEQQHIFLDIYPHGKGCLNRRK